MAFGGNFAPEVKMADGRLQVSGKTTRLDGATLVSRHVALQQPPVSNLSTQFIHGPANLELGWDAFMNAPLAPSDDGLEDPENGPWTFGGGDALAIATETHFIPGGDNPSATASFVTLTWSEPVTIVIVPAVVENPPEEGGEVEEGQPADF